MTDTYDPAKDSFESYNAAIAALRAKLLRERCPAAKRVEVIGGCELYLGDCMEVMPAIEDVDAVVTDPPYVGLTGGEDKARFGGVGRRTVGQDFSVGDIWDATFDWCPLAWDKAKFGAIVFCGNKGVAKVEQAFPLASVAAVITWHKINSPPTGKNVPRFTTEHAVGFAKSPGIKWDRLSSTLIDVPGLAAGCFATERVLIGNKSVHPTQKPIAVMVPLVELVDGIVLDPFMGTGTTGIACVRSGRSFIGIERDPAYFDIACERISKAYSQPDMFVSAPKREEPKQEALL